MIALWCAVTVAVGVYGRYRSRIERFMELEEDVSEV